MGSEFVFYRGRTMNNDPSRICHWRSTHPFFWFQNKLKKSGTFQVWSPLRWQTKFFESWPNFRFSLLQREQATIKMIPSFFCLSSKFFESKNETAECTARKNRASTQTWGVAKEKMGFKKKAFGFPSWVYSFRFHPSPSWLLSSKRLFLYAAADRSRSSVTAILNISFRAQCKVKPLADCVSKSKMPISQFSNQKGCRHHTHLPPLSFQLFPWWEERQSWNLLRKWVFCSLDKLFLFQLLWHFKFTEAVPAQQLELSLASQVCAGVVVRNSFLTIGI